MTTLNEITDLVRQYGRKIGAPDEQMKVYDRPQGDGTPFIVDDGEVFKYITEEKGLIFDEKKTSDLDILLYWLMSGIVFNLSCSYELQNRQPNVDSRRLLFARELELMALLKHSWYEMKKQEIKDTLRQSPFNS